MSCQNKLITKTKMNEELPDETNAASRGRASQCRCPRPAAARQLRYEIAPSYFAASKTAIKSRAPRFVYVTRGRVARHGVRYARPVVLPAAQQARPVNRTHVTRTLSMLNVPRIICPAEVAPLACNTYTTVPCLRSNRQPSWEDKLRCSAKKQENTKAIERTTCVAVSDTNLRCRHCEKAAEKAPPCLNDPDQISINLGGNKMLVISMQDVCDRPTTNKALPSRAVSPKKTPSCKCIMNAIKKVQMEEKMKQEIRSVLCAKEPVTKATTGTSVAPQNIRRPMTAPMFMATQPTCACPKPRRFLNNSGTQCERAQSVQTHHEVAIQSERRCQPKGTKDDDFGLIDEFIEAIATLKRVQKKYAEDSDADDLLKFFLSSLKNEFLEEKPRCARKQFCQLEDTSSSALDQKAKKPASCGCSSCPRRTRADPITDRSVTCSAADEEKKKVVMMRRRPPSRCGENAVARCFHTPSPCRDQRPRDCDESLSDGADDDECMSAWRARVYSSPFRARRTNGAGPPRHYPMI